MTAALPRRAYVGLGANLPLSSQAGSTTPAQTLQLAVKALAESPGVLSVRAASLWASEPDHAEGPSFVNSAAEVLTELSPEALLQTLLSIETRFGRVRPRQASHGPVSAPANPISSGTSAPSPARTLDLDLIWMEDAESQTEQLQLPHPRAATRAFVLKPLLELNPEMSLSGQPLSQLLAGLPQTLQDATQPLTGC